MTGHGNPSPVIGKDEGMTAAYNANLTTGYNKGEKRPEAPLPAYTVFFVFSGKTGAGLSVTSFTYVLLFSEIRRSLLSPCSHKTQPLPLIEKQGQVLRTVPDLLVKTGFQQLLFAHKRILCQSP